MKVLEADFLTSATEKSAGAGWPVEGAPEVAFAGRSNVGKSTLLQALMQRRGLVRISSTPGRTRLINFFRVVVAPDGGRSPQDRRELMFVDLPGYGYAKVSKEEREKWLPFVDQYLSERASLKILVLLVDPRRDMGLDETEIAKYVMARGVLVIAVMTKADKLKKHERKPALQKLERALGLKVLAVSATDGDGVDELWRRIAAAIG
ncbi:MAG TPA: ribosome biogenesis GTP-binding protein YihA/YsxC [Polyangia bacterium]|nr:ribosome biogenesis GTP-binding protein YihA/YsxC [Polyangia bacterium]